MANSLVIKIIMIIKEINKMTSKAKITMEAKEISKTITKAKGIIKMIRICHPKTMTLITKVISMEILMVMILIKVMTNQI